MSISSIRRKAKELNLYKDALCKYKSTFQTWILVQELFGDFSYDEIATQMKSRMLFEILSEWILIVKTQRWLQRMRKIFWVFRR